MSTRRSFRAAGVLALFAFALAAQGAALGAEAVSPAHAAAAVKPATGKAGAPNAAQPSGYAVEPAPPWIVPARESTVARVEPGSMHYRVIDEQIRVDAKGVSDYTHVVRVPNDAAGLATASQIELEFDPGYQTLAFHHLRVVRDGRPIDKLDRSRIRLLQREAQLERQLVDGRTTLSIVLDDVRLGDQIDFAYTLRGANPVFGGKLVEKVWMTSLRGPVALYQVRRLAPPERAIHYRTGAPDIQATSTVAGGLRETVFRRESVPQFRVENGSSANSVMPQVVQLSEFADWADVAAWGQQLFALRRRARSSRRKRPRSAPRRPIRRGSCWPR